MLSFDLGHLDTRSGLTELKSRPNGTRTANYFNMAAVRLIYFDGRGLGEGIRLLLAACGIEFTERFVKEREEYLKLVEDGKLLFEQIPMLEIDGLELVQVGAIFRYIARREDLYGSTNTEAVQIDTLFEGARDFLANFFKIGFFNTEEVLSAAKSKALPRYLPIFDKVLKKNGTGYLVGDKMSFADVALLEVMLTVTEYYGEDAIQEYPSLKAWKTKMTSEEKMSAYLNGPQRKKGNDEKYCSTCRKVLQLPF